MVGGMIVEVIDCGDRLWINCAEMPPSERNPLGRTSECAIYTAKVAGFRPKFGDRIWWHGGYALWTELDSANNRTGKTDVRIPRIGYSGVARPELKERVRKVL